MRIINLLTLLFAFSYLPAQVYYVDSNASGTNDGSTWANAFSDLQTAINSVSGGGGGELWVKFGFYAPSMDENGDEAPTDPRTKTFSTVGISSPNLSIYGGFLGNETARSQRNVTTYVTYLTGLFDVNYHIFSLFSVDETFVVDGFTIEFGTANGAGTNSRGGGIFSDQSSAIIRNCTFTGNSALEGGAIFAQASHCTFEDCIFQQSTASGGTFSAHVYYGLLTAASGNPNTFTRCIFRNNTANASITHAALVENDSYTIYEGCTFHDNDCSSCAGLLWTDGNATSPTTEVIFRNCLMYKNYKNVSWTIWMMRHNKGNMTMENCTSHGNGTSTDYFLYPVSTCTVSNSIFWNPGTEITSSQSGLSIYSSIVEEAIPAGVTGANNLINIDPLFELPGLGDFELQPCSPAYNRGDNGYVNSDNDCAGNERTKFTTVDIGAYEIGTERTALNSGGQEVIADAEVIYPNGWTNYFDCSGNTMLLSVQKNGENIGGLGDGVFEMKVNTNADYDTGEGVDLSAANYVQASSFFANNRSWTLTPKFQPTANVGVRFYYTAKDISDLNGSYPITGIEDAVIYKVPGTDAYDVSVSSANYQQYIYTNGSSSTTEFAKGVEDGVNYVEFQVSSFSSGALGAGDGTNGGALPIELISFDAKKIKNKETQIKFHLFAEMVSKVGVERSRDGRKWERLYDFI